MLTVQCHCQILEPDLLWYAFRRPYTTCKSLDNLPDFPYIVRNDYRVFVYSYRYISARRLQGGVVKYSSKSIKIHFNYWIHLFGISSWNFFFFFYCRLLFCIYIFFLIFEIDRRTAQNYMNKNNVIYFYKRDKVFWKHERP